VIFAITNKSFLDMIYPLPPEPTDKTIDTVEIINNPQVSPSVPQHVIPPPGPYPTRTLELYNQIDAGMTYEDVVALVGEATMVEGETISDEIDDGLTKIPANHTAIVRWNVKDSAGAYFSVIFQNSKAVAKSQSGLR
jgi:hypothetical protein